MALSQGLSMSEGFVRDADGRLVVASDPGGPQSAATSTPVQTNFTYSNGLVTGWQEAGYTYTVARNADGTIASVTRA